GALPPRVALEDASLQAIVLGGIGEDRLQVRDRSPRRKERGQAGLVRRVRVLVRGNVRSRRAGGLEPVKQLLRPAPDELRLELEVADVGGNADRKSTRLNSSHVAISYAVFCL